MSDFLSQEEINKLMGEEEPEGSGSSEPNISNQPIPYKLGQQERIVRGRLPAFELINERIARNLRLDLFNLLQKNVEISISPIKIQKYNELVSLYFKMPEKVHGYVEGKHVLDGIIGKQNEHNAVKIEQIIKEEPGL